MWYYIILMLGILGLSMYHIVGMGFISYSYMVKYCFIALNIYGLIKGIELGINIYNYYKEKK